MILRVSVPRGKGRLAPGTWKGVTGKADIKAVLRCPDCRHRQFLGEKHTVSANGDVNPSVVCPYDDCSWHVHITLLDWPRPPPS